MVGRSRNLTGLLVAAGLAVSFSACSGGSATPSVAPTASTVALANPPGSGPTPRQADREWVELCKDYVGTPGPAATFTIAVDHLNNGTIDQTFQTTVAGGTCKDVWFSDVAGLDVLTITETVPTGYTASWVLSLANENGVITTNPPVSGSVATGVLSRNLLDAGSLVIFTNTFVPPPPPPPGLEGCARVLEAEPSL